MKKIKNILAVAIIVLGMIITDCDLAHWFGMNQYVWNIIYFCVGIPAAAGLLKVWNHIREERS